MGTILLQTDLAAEAARDIVEMEARRLGFSARPDGDGLRLRSGSLPLSFLVGAFTAYCDFRLSPDGDRWMLKWSAPWWTGMIGCRRVRDRAIKLADAVGAGIRREGGSVKRTGP